MTTVGFIGLGSRGAPMAAHVAIAHDALRAGAMLGRILGADSSFAPFRDVAAPFLEFVQKEAAQ
jgi:hypothetical protein